MSLCFLAKYELACAYTRSVVMQGRGFTMVNCVSPDRDVPGESMELPMLWFPRTQYEGMHAPAARKQGSSAVYQDA